MSRSTRRPRGKNAWHYCTAPTPRTLFGGPSDAPAYLTWGSPNLAGTTCWRGAIATASLEGFTTGMTIANRELSAAEVALLARQHP